MSRNDGLAKASGATRYVADMSLPGMLHVALVRSPLPHARIAAVGTSEASAADGVVGVFTAGDVTSATYGRSVRDVPLLARGVVRFAGERVAAVVADSRRAAEAAVMLVDVDYSELPAVLTAEQALAPGAPAVHDAPWDYPGAAARPENGRNVQSRVAEGSLPAAEAALGRSEYVVDRMYTTRSVHQGYLEPQACVVAVTPSAAPGGAAERVRVWATNKSPYRMRAQVAQCLGLGPELIEVQPMPLGGDFGGKGSPQDVPLCVELSRLTGRPVKLVLRYAEDLTATNPRHPARIRVRAGCDRAGHLTAMAISTLADGGAYGGFKPRPNVNLHGAEEPPDAYAVPVFFVESVVAYTNTVPRGHMRSPGAPQATFAVESALDELAAAAGLDPADFRRRNLARTGQPGPHGKPWAEARGEETLAAAMAEVAANEPAAPPGWRHGTGVTVYARPVPSPRPIGIRLVPVTGAGNPAGRIRAEVPIPETGTGSHTVVRNGLAAELGIDPQLVEVAQVATGELPADPGVGGSRVTVGIAATLARAAQAWRERAGAEAVDVPAVPDETEDAPMLSYCAQVARVAVDPATGQVRVLDITTAVDVGQVINPLAHQMQVDGGTVMGYGFACLEDLAEEDGQIGAASLGEFKIASMTDAPVLRTVLVTGGKGATPAGVKPVGELTNVPTSAAIANAVAAATGCRIRDLPITAEKLYWALREAGRDGQATLVAAERSSDR
jgi:CO/xanthine dehydrogenase Mo-binding subunit